jgi:outer membrane protein OmpA-like peptidoglycan-associated protein
VGNTGDRVIVERDGQFYVRKDENEILRRPGSEVQTQTYSDGSSRTVVDRADGTRVVTVRDQNGYVVRRTRVLPDGREILLFDDTRPANDTRPIEQTKLPPVYVDTLPQARYVDYSHANRRQLRDTLMAPPVAELDRSFSLRQVRETRQLRDLMPGLDLDTITFESGSAAITPGQARNLDELGRAMEDILAENPDEVFLIEGHTDAVGSALSNLALSERRAESVALALTEYYDVPPENLFTQGYGEEFLKIQTESSERANRRATVRRITQLLDRTARAQ